MEAENKSKEIILFVFEGEKTEASIYQSLQKYFLNEKRNTIICATFNAEIYQLYAKLKLDEFGYQFKRGQRCGCQTFEKCQTPRLFKMSDTL